MLRRLFVDAKQGESFPARCSGWLVRHFLFYLCAVCSMFATSHAAAYELVVSLNPGGAMQSNDLSQTLEFSGSDSTGVASRYAIGRASVESLGAYLSESISITPGTVAFSDVRVQGTVVFESDPAIQFANVFFSGDLDGTVTGSGGFLTQVSGSLGLNNHTDTFEFGNFGGYTIDETLTAGGTVPTNSPVEFSARMGLRIANGQAGSFVEMDFLNSFSFNANQFFDIQTAGVTANSVNGDWLRNNRLTAVPEPASAALFAAAFVWLSLRRQRKRIRKQSLKEMIS